MKTILSWVVLLGILVACAAPVEEKITVTREEKTAVPATPLTQLNTATPTIPPTNTSVPTPPPPVTATPTATQTRLPTHTPIPSATSLYTPEPSLTPTLEPVEPLTIRQPLLEQVETYLLDLQTGYFKSVDGDLDFYVDSFHWYDGLSEAVELLYVDVNGDGNFDLIVADEYLLAIFLWQEDQYTVPFVLIGYAGQSNSRTAFADWTNDGTPEVVFQYFRPDHWGTGLQHYGWREFVIDCQADRCNIILSYTPVSLDIDYNFGGVLLTHSNMQREADEHGNLLLQQIETGFQIYYLGGGLGYNEPDLSHSLAVFTSTQSIYQWNGFAFELASEEILSDSYVIDEQASLEVESELGHATISFENNHGASANNDVCQLFVDDQSVGGVFGCKNNFTSIEWQDVTGDEQPEIVIQTLSGSNPSDENWNQLADIDCVHQRLLIYQWDGETAVEIANIAGCVVQPDLYGVRLEDWDGQVEILAASGWFTEPECNPDGSWVCWQEFAYQNEIYKWNGQTFTLWTVVSPTPEP